MYCYLRQDLSNYKYDKMINKSLLLLNKFYSSKTKLFKMAVQAMVSVRLCCNDKSIKLK